MQKPPKDEYNPYFQRYIDLVPDGDCLSLLKQNTEKTIKYFESIPDAKHDYAYAEGKWTIKEVLMHITDTERVMCYRAFVAARGDSNTILYGMAENHYAANADVSKRSLADILIEFKAVRTATEKLYENINEEQSRFKARGTEFPFTARALGYIMIGHVEHHINVMNERYL